MYEKSIANEHRVFAITIPDTPALVIDLLSPADKAIYNSLLFGDGENFNPYDTVPLNKEYRRIPVDGYVLSNVNAWYMGTKLGGAFETIPQDERCTFPVSFWLEKSYIYAPAPIAGLVRIFFS
jgi:hypothetical protein